MILWKTALIGDFVTEDSGGICYHTTNNRGKHLLINRKEILL